MMGGSEKADEAEPGGRKLDSSSGKEGNRGP